jgi:hypothetical protein
MFVDRNRLFRRSMAHGLIVALGLTSLCPTAVRAQECAFQPWLTYRETELRLDQTAGAYVYVTSRKAVDADGAPNAYHPDDVGRPCTAEGTGLDCPANAGFPGADWWPTVLAADPANPERPYVQESGEFAGFFVSKTALHDRGNPIDHDRARYVDARTVPYIVFPRPFYRLQGTGRLGDVGFALNLESGDGTFFVVGDIGPNEPLGEASIGLFEALGGEHVSARTGHGVPLGRIAYMVFPYSSGEMNLGWPIESATLARVAQPLLEAAGGVAALRSCFGH